MVLKVGFAKVGNIGSAVLIEFLLDERAEREDIDVRVVSSGAKLGVEQATEVGQTLVGLKPNLVIITTPNAALPGPTKLREIFKEANLPTITVSDAPAKKAVKSIEEAGQGYIIVEADSMLGARREFLDPVEMALFNADIIKVLAITGAYNILRNEIDAVIDALKRGEKPSLPRIIIDKEKAIANSGLQNPYARAKAMAAYEMARRVADLTVEGCFVVKEMERYMPLIAAGHEMLAAAALLADEARSIEKCNDTVYRSPHYDDGTILRKYKFAEKPSKPSS
jgi:methylenetetrahydromethanopterin dehydrogenase